MPPATSPARSGSRSRRSTLMSTAKAGPGPALASCSAPGRPRRAPSKGGAPAVPVSFLTEDQERRYGRFAGDPSPEQLARHFHLDDADHAFVAGHRGAHMRLGCAVQLGTVRFLGTFLEDPTDVPARVVRCLAEQLDLTADGHMAAYRASGWRWRHPVEIREAYGYRTFDAPGLSFRLTRWLYALCWTGTDRPSVLFDRATVWLMASKVLLPGATTLERLVARVRARASERLWQRLSMNVTPAQRERLEALLRGAHCTRCLSALAEQRCTEGQDESRHTS